MGHSDRDADALLELLRDVEIDLLVDVRRYPGSRRHPHFNGPALERILSGAGIAYRHQEELGGYRDVRHESPHTALARSGFRAYADHMETDAFRRGLDRILDDAERRRVSVLCAEADPDRCHRRMIADAVVARGRRVVHLLEPGLSREHELDERARVRDDGGLLYADPRDAQRELFGEG